MPQQPEQKPPPQQQAAPVDPYLEWLQEETARINGLSDMARQGNIVIGTGGGHPPQLNPDGSLAQTKETG